MREIQTEIEINAAPEEVWRVLTDFGAYPEWNPFVKSVSGEPREGGRLEIFVQVPEGPGMRFKPKVLRAEPARELRWVGSLAVPGLFNGEHFFKLEPAGPGRTRFVHGERFTGLMIPFMGGVLRKTHRGYLLMNDALKARVEGAGGGTR
ncbi:MAG TPA: SRPBCC domain-containing protein [Pyrinomonadaceae bacterium]|nr:SRPBCC domain-containing protein [Pyrinomonadaceae bacterium]